MLFFKKKLLHRNNKLMKRKVNKYKMAGVNIDEGNNFLTDFSGVPKSMSLPVSADDILPSFSTISFASLIFCASIGHAITLFSAFLYLLSIELYSRFKSL